MQTPETPSVQVTAIHISLTNMVQLYLTAFFGCLGASLLVLVLLGLPLWFAGGLSALSR